MLKISRFSLIAMLVVLPMAVFAATDATVTTTLTKANNKAELATNADNVIFAGNPYWPGQPISNTDRIAPASAAYVKGAYNEAISAANEAALKLSLLSATVQQIVSALSAYPTKTEVSNTYATKTGVTATISASSASGTFNLASDWASGATEGTVTVSSTITGATYTGPS